MKKDDWFTNDYAKKFISFSGGVESTTMCVLFGRGVKAIFADTGFEHQIIYDRLDLVERWCKKEWGNDFEIIRVKNDKYISLPDYILESHFYPNFQSRYCTRMFKIEPIDKYLDQFKDKGVELMIGLNAEETDRTGNHGNKAFINYRYPLIENVITRQKCIEVLKHVGLKPQFPPYMKRGGCIGCYFKSVKEYEAMALLNPSEFKVVEDLESNMQDIRQDFFSIHQNMPMKQIRENVSNLIFKPEEIYPVVNDVTMCGVFCNR